MAEFTVTVEGKDYEVTAPDERTAWTWANYAHRQAGEPSIGEGIARQAGLGARAVLKGAAAVPTMMAEAAALPLRAMTGGRYFQSPTAALERTLSQAGLPEAASASERVAQDVIGTMTGVGTVAKGAQMLARGASAAAKPYLNMLAANPLAQQFSAAGAGAGGALARESGAGPTGQFAAAAGGAFLPAIAPAVMAPIRMGRNIVDPWLPGGIERSESRVLNKLAGNKRAAIIAALKANQQMVSGSIPTAAQAAAPAGSAEFVAAENFARKRLPSAFEDIAQAQNAARIRALRSVGQTKTALETAEQAREATAGPLYREARALGVDPEMAQILRPQIKNLLQRMPGGVLSKARELARIEGEKFTKAGSVSGLHYVKKAIDELLAGAGETGLGPATKRALSTFKSDLLTVLEDLSPKYAKGLRTYRSMSPDIDQMRVGQYLEEKLTPALSDLGASSSQRGTVYAQAIRDAEKTVERSLGGPVREISEVLTKPGQMEAVTGVGRDLAREATRERLSRAGTEQAGRIIGHETPTLPAVGPLEQKYMIVKTVLNRIKGNLSDRQLDDLAIKMQNAPELARIMQLTGPARAEAEAGLLRRAALAAVMEQAQ